MGLLKIIFLLGQDDRAADKSCQLFVARQLVRGEPMLSMSSSRGPLKTAAAFEHTCSYMEYALRRWTVILDLFGKE